MTREPDLGALLDRIGWTTGEAADRLGVAGATVRDGASERRRAPPTVIAWLAGVAAAVEACPAQPEGWSAPGPGRRPASLCS